VKYRELYIDGDASRFDPAHATSAQWETMWNWRTLMNAVLPRTSPADGRSDADARTNR
jgi:hypothetical protein